MEAACRPVQNFVVVHDNELILLYSTGYDMFFPEMLHKIWVLQPEGFLTKFFLQNLGVFTQKMWQMQLLQNIVHYDCKTEITQKFQLPEDIFFSQLVVSVSGKVLVHCLMGMSRSSTCVLSYLMIKIGLTAAEALRRLRLHRDIRPNDGFLRQLAELDNKLRRERGRMENH